LHRGGRNQRRRWKEMWRRKLVVVPGIALIIGFSLGDKWIPKTWEKPYVSSSSKMYPRGKWQLTEWQSRWDGVPDAGWAWYNEGNGWGEGFYADPYPGNGIDSIAIYCWPSDWPNPGGNYATLIVYEDTDDDGAPDFDTVICLDSVYVNRGSYTYFDVDEEAYTVVDHFFLFYIQVGDYPYCPGIAVDATLNYPTEQWSLFNGTFYDSEYDISGDCGLCVKLTAPTGVSEWVPFNPHEFEARIIPNPATTNLEIDFTLPKKSMVIVKIHDTVGRTIRTVYQGSLEKGSHSFNWDLKDETGKRVSPGIYIYTIEASGYRFSGRISVVR